MYLQSTQRIGIITYIFDLSPYRRDILATRIPVVLIQNAQTVTDLCGFLPRGKSLADQFVSSAAAETRDALFRGLLAFRSSAAKDISVEELAQEFAALKRDPAIRIKNRIAAAHTPMNEVMAAVAMEIANRFLVELERRDRVAYDDIQNGVEPSREELIDNLHDVTANWILENILPSEGTT